MVNGLVQILWGFLGSRLRVLVEFNGGWPSNGQFMHRTGFGLHGLREILWYLSRVYLLLAGHGYGAAFEILDNGFCGL